jgi:hypothetical protein
MCPPFFRKLPSVTALSACGHFGVLPSSALGRFGVSFSLLIVLPDNSPVSFPRLNVAPSDSLICVGHFGVLSSIERCSQ